MNALILALAFTSGVSANEEHALDLELEVEGARRLFPLMPGTKCPAGHTCRPRHHVAAAGHNAVAPLFAHIKDHMKGPVTAMQEQELNNDLNTVVSSGDYCTRRAAMARVAGMAAGMSLAGVSTPAFAAEAGKVGMGTDSGQLVFVPAKLKICKGDSVTWTMVKAGPHNVVFDEEDVPAGVDTATISMDSQIGDEGETFTMKFDVPGNYGYYCEPHRSAGMVASLTVA